MKINYTKSEVERLKSEIYFTKDELKILEYWLLDYSIVQMAEELKLSTSTISRRKKTIREKINKAP